MGRKLRTEQYGVFPDNPDSAGYSEKHRFRERDRVVGRALAERAGLPSPEQSPYQNLGNRELPIYGKKEIIQKNLRDHQISMVEGDTGSGKSTQIVQYALEMGYQKVVYLEPRILQADNISAQIERELAGELGEETAESLIGVRHSERSTGRDKTIEVMTPGTYMRVVDELDDYKEDPVLVVGDEIHEKDFESELAVAISVQKMQENPNWRLGLVSATLDSQSIHEAYSDINGQPIPLTSVEGRPHELETIEEPDLTPAEAYAKYGANHQKALIFTAGKAEIKDISNQVSENSSDENLRITPLHAKLSHSEIKAATDAQLEEDERQAIPSTSAGQSGITIPDLTLVITDGTTRRPNLDEDGVSGLYKEYCAQDEIIQQGGRAGRDVSGGTVIYTKPDDESFHYQSLEERDKQAPAQIHHTNLSRNVLNVASKGRDFYELNQLLIHKVEDQRRILEAYDSLYRLGAIDEHNDITELGELMNKFPVRPESSRAIAEAINRGASKQVMQHLVAMTSAIEAGGMRYFEKGVGDNWRDDIRRETEDDFTAELDMFYATRPFCQYNQIDKYMEVDEAELQERNYDLKNTRQAHKTYDKISRVLDLETADMDLTPPTADQVEEVQDYLLSGLFDFAYYKSGVSGSDKKAEYTKVYEGEHSKVRHLSDRGIYKGDDSLVIGMPRNFEKHEKDRKTKETVLREHNVIENVFPTSVQKLTRHVLHVADRQAAADSKVVGGRLEQTDALYFGKLKIGEEKSADRLQHSTATREQLREAAYNKPTHTVKQLVEIKKQLEDLVRVTPSDEVATYFPRGVMTHDWLQQTIDDAIDDEVDSVHSLDNKLRTMMVHKNISLETWISEDNALEILERSPEFIQLGEEVSYSLYYSHGQPIINGFNLRDVDNLPHGRLSLEDGRQVLIRYQIDKNAKNYSAQQIRDYADSLISN